MLVLPEAWRKRWKGRDIFSILATIEGKVYREKDGRKTFCFSMDGKNYYAKLHGGIGWKKLLTNLLQFRLPVLSAQNEWQAIQILEKLGVQTMHLVGYGKSGWNPARRRSFVITKELVNTTSLEDFCRDWHNAPPSAGLKRMLIIQVAQIARMIHENGMNHRDLYICHFLLEDIPAPFGTVIDQMNLYLIDLHRVQIRRNTPLRWRIKDIAALYFSSMDIGLTRRDLFRFIREYKKEPLRVTLNRDSTFWRRVENRGEAFYKEYIRKGRGRPRSND